MPTLRLFSKELCQGWVASASAHAISPSLHCPSSSPPWVRGFRSVSMMRNFLWTGARQLRAAPMLSLLSLAPHFPRWHRCCFQPVRTSSGIGHLQTAFEWLLLLFPISSSPFPPPLRPSCGAGAAFSQWGAVLGLGKSWGGGKWRKAAVGQVQFADIWFQHSSPQAGSYAHAAAGNGGLGEEHSSQLLGPWCAAELPFSPPGHTGPEPGCSGSQLVKNCWLLV